MKIELTLDELDLVQTLLEGHVNFSRLEKGLISERDFIAIGLIEKVRSLINQHPQNT